MNIIEDIANKAITLQFTNQEWSTIRHLNKVHGSTFIKNFIENFLQKRAEQRRANRSDALINAFISASSQTQQQILNALSLDFSDE